MALQLKLGSKGLLSLREMLWRVQRHLSKRVLVLEFASDALLAAQFQIHPKGLKLCGFVREALPAGAVERGTPADPQLMSVLISSLCKEQLLVAHRSVVLLPPEAVHCSSHWLPADLGKPELQQMLLQSAPPVLLPFPLGQTDFDVLPHSTFSGLGLENQQLWTILAVASRLSDRLLQCLRLADQECMRIELSSLSLTRLAQPHLASLKAGQTALILEFDRDQTHVVVVSADGPLQADRLTAIRAYPHGEPDAQESYLPLSEIDLQAFVADLNHLLEHLQADEFPQVVSKIVVAGVNSAHPSLVDLLNGMLPMPVVGFNLFENPALDGLDQLALTESCFFYRVVGAAMALVPHLSFDYALAETASSDEVTATNSTALQQEKHSENSESSQSLDDNNRLLEAEMYSDAHPNFEDIPEQRDFESALVMSSSDIQQEQEQEKDQDEFSLSSSFQQTLDSSHALTDSEPLLSTDVEASPASGPPAVAAQPPAPEATPQVIPTDDPTTWPSVVGKRRRRRPLTEQSPTANAQPATPWQSSMAAEVEESMDSDESTLFSFGSDQAPVNTGAVSSPRTLMPESEPTGDVEGEARDVADGLFSFSSDTGSSPHFASKDVVDESESDSDYSLGLGEP